MNDWNINPTKDDAQLIGLPEKGEILSEKEMAARLVKLEELYSKNSASILKQYRSKFTFSKAKKVVKNGTLK